MTCTASPRWPVATDNVGVVGFPLERCTGVTCTNFAQVRAIGRHLMAVAVSWEDLASTVTPVTGSMGCT